MALDYRKCAQEIVDHIGGRENVAQAAHCATRLRLVIKDNSKVDKAYLDELDGVKGMFESNGQLQLIIGTGTVNKVYDEFLSITGMTAATKDDVKAAAAAKQPMWRRLLKPIGDVFVPILPAIVASGLLMGIINFLGNDELVKAGFDFKDTDWYGFLNLLSNTAFSYLPVLVAISAARVFGGNIFLGAVVGLMMVHSSLTNGWNAADGYDVWYLFGHLKIGGYTLGQVNQLGYQGHVIPVILAVLFMCKIEKWLHDHVPEMLDLFIVPITTVFSTAVLTFCVIGPIFSALENLVLNGAKLLVTNPAGACAMGALYPWTVVMGLHHMYNVIESGMLSSAEFNKLNIWMPIASAANFAQFGACLAVGLRTHNQKTKAVAVPSSLSAALGITEPAIFGVNMRFFKPFIGGMIGGAVGALLGSFMGIGAKSYGVTGIPGYLTIDNPLLYTILLAVSGGLAFIITCVIYKEETAPAAAASAAPAVEAAPTNVIMSCEAGEILAPVAGKIISREEIPDETFASGVLGEGVAVIPDGETVYAPFDGTISTVAESKHAVGITGNGDMELLIHVGVDTVAMNGEGFTTYVKEGDEVKAGQKLLTFSKKMIADAGHPDCVVTLLTNAEDFSDFAIR